MLAGLGKKNGVTPEKTSRIWGTSNGSSATPAPGSDSGNAVKSLDMCVTLFPGLTQWHGGHGDCHSICPLMMRNIPSFVRAAPKAGRWPQRPVKKSFSAGGPERSREGWPHHQGPEDTEGVRRGQNRCTTSALAIATGCYTVVFQRPADTR